MLKHNTLFSLLFVFLAITMSGCDLVGDILEFGFWSAFIIIGLVVLIIFGIFRALKR